MRVFLVAAVAALITFFYFSNQSSEQTMTSTPPVQDSSDSQQHQQKNRTAQQKPAKENRSVAQENEANASSTTSGIDSESEFERRYPGKWRFRKKADQSIQSITGALIPGVGKNSASALKFANEIAPLFAKGRFQLANEARKTASNERMQSFQVDQFAEGFKVYQGSMQIIARATDGDAYIVNNMLKDIQPFNNNATLTVSQATEIVEKKYPRGTVTAPESPQVFSTARHGTQLAWVLTYNARFPRATSRDVVVSAEDGQILYEEEFVVHD